jgi:hypothetical protein
MEQNINKKSDSVARESEIAELVEAWFVESLHNSPVSRATDIFNHVRVAVDALKLRLAAFLQEH